MTTSTGVPYAGAQLALYNEALRLVPALIKTKIENDVTGAFTLYGGLVEDGDAAGLTREETWATFSTAAMSWATQLFVGVSEHLALDIDVLLKDAIRASVFWPSHEH